MNKEFRNNEMKDFVGPYFIRVCKNHKVYSIFKSRFNDIKKSRGDRNPFGEFNDIHEMFDKVNDFTEREYQNHRRTNDKYEKVTMMINHMLHFFLEKGHVDPRRLGGIGQEIFDLSCYSMFGDEFLTDMENMKNNPPPPPSQGLNGENIDSRMMELMHQYIKLMQNGRVNMTFKDFVEWHRQSEEETEEEVLDDYDDREEVLDDYDDREEVF